MDETTPAIRVSDQDRSDIMRQLCDAFGEGRLDQAEFEARTDRALAAVTHADLRTLTDDLPVDRRSVEKADKAELLLETRYWIAGAVLMNGTWAVQSLIAEHAVRYWPGLPLAIWALVLVGAMIVPRSTTKDKKQPAPEISSQPSRQHAAPSVTRRHDVHGHARAVEPARRPTHANGSHGDTPPTGAR